MINLDIRSLGRRIRASLAAPAIVSVFFVFISVSAHALPTFNKTFNPATIGPGSTTTLTFTITNDANSVGSLSFIDNLPTGVVIANPANATQNCDANLSAPPGGTSIVLSDGRLAANQSCLITVNVTSSVIDTHTNVSGDLSSSGGNSGNATANLNVVADRPGFSKSFSPSSISLGGRSTLSFNINNSANTALARSVTFTDNLPDGIEIADPANVMNTCAGGVLSANPGSGAISFTPALFGETTIDAGSSCLISVEVVSTAVGALLNTSSELTSLNAAFQPVSSGFASAELAVNVSTVNLSKTFVDDPVAPGATVELRFNITNRDRRSTATDIAFSDDLNSILSGLAAVGSPANDVCGAGSTLSGTGVITLSGGSLEGGASCTFSVTLQVPASAAAGGYTNLSSPVTANLNGSPFTGNMASDTLFVEAGPSLSKTFLSNSIGGGDVVAMEFTVANNSASSSATNISFSDNLSAFIDGAMSLGLPIADVCGAGSSINAFTPTTDAFAIQLVGGNLGAGESCTFSVNVLIPEGAADGVQTNVTSTISATIDGTTRVGNEAQASLTVVSAPELAKQFIDDPVAPGGQVTLEFTLSASEEGAGNASQITFSDDLDAALSGLVATGLPINDVCGVGSSLNGTSNIVLNNGSLNIGESCTFSVTLDVPANALPGSYNNQTSGVSAQVAGITTTGSGGADTLVVAGLDISKSFLKNPVIPGSTVTMELQISNTSASLDASNILVTDNLSDFISGAAEAGNLPLSDVCGVGSTLSAIGNLIVLQNGNLLAGESCNINVDIIVPVNTNDGIYQNVTGSLSATIGGTNVVLNAANANLQVSSELIGLSKAFAEDSIILGTTTSLEFVVSNLSATETITDIAFSDDLDASLSGLIASNLPLTDVCGSGSSVSGTSLIALSGGSLAPGASCMFSVELSVPPSAAGVNSISNTTSPSTGLVDGLPVVGAAASDTAIVVNVDFSKSFETPVIAGDTSVLTFTIQNNGASALDRLFFTDDLEAVLPGLVATGLPAADVCSEGSLLTGSSVLTLTGGILAPGESCQFAVDVSIPATTFGGNYQNVTSVLNNTPIDVAPPAIAPLDVLVRDAQFEKSFAAAADPGTTTTLNFEIQNTGTAELNDLSFSDDLDAVLSGLSATGLPLTDICGAGSTLSGASEITFSGGNLLPNTSCQFSVDVDIPADSVAGDYTNTTSSLDEASNSIAEPAIADLTVNAILSAEFSKSFGAAVNPGGSTSLNFEIKNTSNAPLTQLTFSDNLGAVLTGLTASGLPLSDACGAGSTLSGSASVSLNGGNLEAGASCQFSVQVNVPTNTAAGDFTNTTSALTEGSTVVADPASAVITVNQVNNDKVTICWKPGTFFQRELMVKRRLANILIYFGLAIEGSCPAPEPKVTLCHKYYKWYYWGKARYKTIHVPKHRVYRHLWHGDRLGACK